MSTGRGNNPLRDNTSKVRKGKCMRNKRERDRERERERERERDRERERETESSDGRVQKDDEGWN